MNKTKIGLLLPKSSLYPSLTFDLTDGIKAGLASEGLLDNIELLYENIGFGGESNEIYSKAEKLILQNDVRFIIAFLDHMEAAKLDNLIIQTKTLLLVLDPGGHIPTEWVKCPNRFHISLQAAIGSRLTGELASQENASPVVFANSFYEAGYLQCFAYLRGFESAGGQVHSYITVPFVRENFNITPLVESCKLQKTNAVLAQFSAESGNIFLQEFEKTGLNKSITLYSSPFMLEETWLSTITYETGRITGYVCWLSDLANQANVFFINSLKAFNDKSGNIFSMLGWEASLVISKYQALIKQNNQLSCIIEALEQTPIDSPRGQLQIHPEHHYWWSHMYLVNVIRNQHNSLKSEFLSKKDISKEEFDLYTNDIPQGIFSKWTNTYLCI